MEQVADTGHVLVAHREKQKAAGNAAHQQGDVASKVLASQRHHALQSVSTAVGIVYELPKKMGAFPKHPRI